MKIETQEIIGTLSCKEGNIAFIYNSHSGRLTLTVPKAVKWETLKMWLEVLEESTEHKGDNATTPVQGTLLLHMDKDNNPRLWPQIEPKPPRWASNKDAARHYRVSKSTVHEWGLKGRIRRRASGKRHSLSGGPIWQYDVSHNYTDVPPKHTYSVQH